MKAYVINSYAHPSKVPLTLDAPEPKAGPGQVIVDVYSAGLNFFDVRLPLSFWSSISLGTPLSGCRSSSHKGSTNYSLPFHGLWARSLQVVSRRTHLCPETVLLNLEVGLICFATLVFSHLIITLITLITIIRSRFWAGPRLLR